MKKLLLPVISLFLVQILAGCGPYEKSETLTSTAAAHMPPDNFMASGAPEEEIDVFMFFSLEEFLDSHRAARLGRAMGEFTESSANLVSLERFYLPTTIPETHRLFRIDVYEQSIGLWYFPEEYIVSGNTFDAMIRQRHFLFSFTRGLNAESGVLRNPLTSEDGTVIRPGITEDDLIYGKYHFTEPNSFMWSSGGEILILHTPVLPIVGLTDDIADPAELVRYAATVTLDLTDLSAVEALLEELGLAE